MTKEDDAIKPEVVTHFASEPHTKACYTTNPQGQTIRTCIIKPSNG